MSKEPIIAIAVFNPTERIQTIAIQLNKKNKMITIDANALQTIIIKSN